MGLGSRCACGSEKVPMPVFSGASSGSGRENEEREGTITGGERVEILGGGGGNDRTGATDCFFENDCGPFTLKEAADDDGETGIFSDPQLEVLQAVGEQNNLACSADGTRSAAGGDDGHLRVVECSSHKTISVPGLENDRKSAVVREPTDQERLHYFKWDLLDFFFKVQPHLGWSGKEWASLVPDFHDWFLSLPQILGCRKKKRTILVVCSDKCLKKPLVDKLHNTCSGNDKFQAFYLGGNEIVRRVYKHYNSEADGTVYLVDVAKREEFGKVKKDLALLSARVAVLILGLLSVQLEPERQPMRVSVGTPTSEDELRNSLGLKNYTTGKGKVNLGETNKRPIKVMMLNTVQDMGCKEGLEWLFQNMQ